MSKSIPNLSEYYLENGYFKCRSKWPGRVKLLVSLALVVVCFIPAVASYAPSVSPKMFFSTEESALHDYISKKAPKISVELSRSVLKWSKEFNIDPKVILAIIEVESGFDQYAISSAGALGLMQVMVKPHLDKIRLAKQKLNTPELFNIDTNVFLGSWVLRSCIDQYKVDATRFQCYNGSIGYDNGYNSKVMNAHFKISKYIKENT